ncbi:MAG: transcription-repair coupling factor [Oscillospiraceae bacterium]|nr:transcription-repair coupling factor [Oscillospiraceae bacterium]
MKQLTQIVGQIPEFRRLSAALEGGKCPAVVSGLAPVHRAQFAAALMETLERPVVIICADEDEGDRLAGDLLIFAGREPLRLTSRELIFHQTATVSRQWEHRRLSVMRAMLEGEAPLVIATVEGLLQRTMPRDVFLQTSRTLRAEERYDLNELSDYLAKAGYVRCGQVEGVGQFSVRGGILDFFSPAHHLPVRVEFWDNEIDSMGLFDAESQRRTLPLKEAVILPAGEVLTGLSGGEAALGGDRELPHVYPQMATAADYLPQDAVVCFSESGRVAERAKNYLWQMEEDCKILLENQVIKGENAVFARSMEELALVLERFPVCYFDSFAASSYPIAPRTVLSVMAKQLPSFGGSLETAVGDLEHYHSETISAVVLVSSERRALNLQSLLRERSIRTAVDFALHELPQKGKAVIAVGGLSAGFEYPGAGFAVLTEGQPPAPGRKKRPRADSGRQKLESYADLSVGDLVVHETHGIGRFAGMVKMPVDGVEKDYVKLTYAGADALYVPATQLDMVAKYIGGGEDDGTKKLSRLGGTDWEKAKSRARKAVAELAKGLIQLYAERQRLAGYAFGSDTAWQKEFEDQFEYEPTEDQMRCIGEIKRDMERPLPMDRLLCGDVGYGKTEVAFRAVMKCVMEGKQAAILVPTTVLARQHFLNAKQRFAKYPVVIDTVNRFRTAAQIRSTLGALGAGHVDVLIGTHRLLQKDVKFKELGLLVVDEEQRFGVSHKEKLKELSRQVDVLTLSATPIPRTLNMALSGIRDMSTIEEPPADRQPVQTYVLEHDWSVLADAMRREIERGGQAYYLHNRVETIDRAAFRISDLLGERARVGVAHGKMTEEQLGGVMQRMTDGELDVLVCTTIIETGIDIPNVNTLIIEDADKLGLAQLHQIRGRVGRSNRRGHAYMTYRQGKVLTEVAAKRLSAIREYAEFGSGFKIAMRDLEIRGAGNVLGPEQSGFLMSVGYDLYLKLLEEAVLEERGEVSPSASECAADLTVVASIPEGYVPSPEQRMDLYRRIARIRREEQADDLTDELIDRYGEPPRPVNNLIAVALLRGAAALCGITEISQKGSSLTFALNHLALERVSKLCAQDTYKGRLLFSAGERPYLALRVKSGEDVLRLARRLVDDFTSAEPET